MESSQVLILGGGGHIGSALTAHLRCRGFAVTSIDNSQRPNLAGSALGRDFRDLSATELAGFGAVILLAGHSSVSACDRDPTGAFANNVIPFIELVHKLHGQRLIFASTSSVYVRTGARLAVESESLPEPACLYDLHKRVIEQYARIAYPNSFALRFGTVCGASPNLRTDVLLNSLVWSAIKRNEVRVANRAFHRPLLGLGDLCHAVETLLHGTADPGVYNLASVNVTIGDVADYVAKRFCVPCVEINTNTQYDMSVSTEKFVRATGFAFTDTVPELVEQLAAAIGKTASTG